MVKDANRRQIAAQQQKRGLIYLAGGIGLILIMPIIGVVFGNSSLSVGLYLVSVFAVVILVRRGSKIWRQAQRTIDDLNRRKL